MVDVEVSASFCPTADGKNCSSGDVEKALMWLFFQSGESTDSVLHLFVMSLGIFICICSRIILTPIMHLSMSDVSY